MGAVTERTPYYSVGTGASVCRTGRGGAGVCSSKVVGCTPAAAGRVGALVNVVAKSLALGTLSGWTEA